MTTQIPPAVRTSRSEKNAELESRIMARFEPLSKLLRARISPTLDKEKLEGAEKTADYVAAIVACRNRKERRKEDGERHHMYGMGSMATSLKTRKR